MARLREFEIGEALDGVMSVFWRQGYEGASMQDIEAATGLNKQSLYRIFPDKRAMYLAALERYEDKEFEKAEDVLSGPGTAQERFEALFGGVIALAAAGDRRGCFLCNAAADQGQEDDEATAAVSAAMQRLEKIFRKALAASPPYDRDRKAREDRAAALLASYLGLRILTKADAPLRVIKSAASAAIKTI
ncbi:TetR/AcrR family transcriptional regulator [Hyphococcus sp.]|uniref:TetR/AcrR family transcriptional regulator n=1 Tax=Hyphococcus sp. TaxID=2038636 RepID=UPI0035C74A8E